MPTAGYIWIEGTALHYIDSTGAERADTGTQTGAVGQPGFLWIEGNNIHYIDASGSERYLTYTDGTASGATPGYLWVENTDATRKDYLNYIITGGTGKYWHGNTSHADHDDSWSNHANVGHGDWSQHEVSSYGDTPHDDLPWAEYWDVYQTYIDVHGDVAHGDTPWADWNNYSDTPHADHTDAASHADTAHEDTPPTV